MHAHAPEWLLEVELTGSLGKDTGHTAKCMENHGACKEFIKGQKVESSITVDSWKGCPGNKSERSSCSSIQRRKPKAVISSPTFSLRFCKDHPGRSRVRMPLIARKMPRKRAPSPQAIIGNLMQNIPTLCCDYQNTWSSNGSNSKESCSWLSDFAKAELHMTPKGRKYVQCGAASNPLLSEVKKSSDTHSFCIGKWQCQATCWTRWADQISKHRPSLSLPWRKTLLHNSWIPADTSY